MVSGTSIEGLPLYVNSSGDLIFVGSGGEQILGTATATSITKSYTAVPGNSGAYYTAGFYDIQAADENLTQAAATATFGTADGSFAAHAFLVAGGAGSASGGTGAVEIEVSGTSITDAGVRTAADTEVIVADITAMSANVYYETAKKWIGTVTYTLQPASGSTQTTYSADFNIGLAKYDDLGNRDFTVEKFEVTGLGGATDTGFNVRLIEHSAANWTYHATAFAIPTANDIVNMNTDHNTETDLAAGDPFAYKRTGLSSAIYGSRSTPSTSQSNGFIVRVDIGTNNSVAYMNAHVGYTLGV